jgi:hypothetical protein
MKLSLFGHTILDTGTDDTCLKKVASLQAALDIQCKKTRALERLVTNKIQLFPGMVIESYEQDFYHMEKVIAGITEATVLVKYSVCGCIHPAYHKFAIDEFFQLFQTTKIIDWNSVQRGQKVSFKYDGKEKHIGWVVGTDTRNTLQKDNTNKLITYIFVKKQDDSDEEAIKSNPYIWFTPEELTIVTE